LQRPLAPFLPSTNDTPSLPTLLSLDTQSYSSRLAGKHLLLEGPHAPLSDLVTGKKRHRGDPEARARARREAEEKEEARREAGIVGERKRRKLGGIVRKSSRISYVRALPSISLR
jgi:ribonuclease P protein subunit POP4